MAESVDAGPYPDGPCLDRRTRDDLRAALAALRRYEVVEGYVVKIAGSDEPGGARYFHRSTDDKYGIPDWGIAGVLLVEEES